MQFDDYSLLPHTEGSSGTAILPGQPPFKLPPMLPPRAASFVRYSPAILMASFTLIAVTEIVLFFVIGDLQWGRDTDFSGFRFLDQLLGYPIALSLVATLPLGLVVALVGQFVPYVSEPNLEALHLIQCAGSWVRLCFPTIPGTIAGLFFYTVIVSALNHAIVRRVLSRRKPRRIPNQEQQVPLPPGESKDPSPSPRGPYPPAR